MKTLFFSLLLSTVVHFGYSQIGFPININFTISGVAYSQTAVSCKPGVSYQFVSEASPVCSLNSYRWTFFGSNISVSDPTAPAPTVIFPALSRDMLYSIRVTVEATNSSPNEICWGAGEKMKTNYIFVPKSGSGKAGAGDSLVVSDNMVSILNSVSLFEGGWSSTNGSRTSVISTTADKKRLFFLTNTMLVDPSILEFEVTADGVKIPTTFFESGSVVIYAGKLDIRQVNDGQNIRGNWKLLQQPEIASTIIPWAAYPSLNKEVLVANLGTAQDFVLHVNNTTGCVNVSCNVFIDGNVVKDQAGNPAPFIPGSSFIGFGKNVKLKAQGTCSPVSSIPVTGTMELPQSN